MNGKLLLDTNIMIAIFAGDAEVKTSLANANEVFVPSVALGELYYGAHKSSRVEANISRINEFAASSSVLTCDTETSKEYGKIKNSLRIKGRPIPENDIWIAAIAKQYELILISRDEHFEEIDELSVIAW
ncbi:MAG: type II toxin-antitoxin system VapC family toxin [Gammaproteobacteria bacterium]|nr:type II toxin-antitoxin system VapC family toxin [Gammaproteobacteria bacterium]